MSQPAQPEASPVPEVAEVDKPFYLVLILLFAVIGIGVLGILKGILDLNQFLSALFPLLGAGLGLYFSKGK